MITFEQKQAAEEALHWILKFVGEGTFWHERHYPALRLALDAVAFDPTPATYVLSGLDAPAGTPGGELVSTSESAPDVATTETSEPPEDSEPADTSSKKGKAK